MIGKFLVAVAFAAAGASAFQYTAGLAMASDSGNLAASRSYESLANAQAKAMAACDDPACKIVASVASPGFYALQEDDPK